MLETVAVYSLPLVALLIGIGGVFGFVKAKSKASLIAGLASAALLLLAYFLGVNNTHTGLTAGAVVNAALIIVFIMRLKKTGKFMPAGVMLAICTLDLLLLLAGLLVK